MPEKTIGVECYLVGGAVRDKILGLTPTERDWVVVGSNPAQMKSKGFKAVGKNFPVFIHPQSGEEYALARTERKTRPGYTGFEFQTGTRVTLQEDLLRRDLTVNAMAKDDEETLIDPFGGRDDVYNRVLRHVSDAFIEDPLRVLRVARFKAQLSDFDFVIAGETLELMKRIVKDGELQALTVNRIWQETEKALLTAKPSIYFETLRECGALKILFPEVDALYGVPQRADYHPEVDSGIHTMMVLDRATELDGEIAVKFSALTHDLGKALTAQSCWPRHVGHEKKGLVPLKSLCQRLAIPKNIRKIAELCCEHHLLMHKLNDLRSKTIFKLIDKLDGFRHPQHIEQYVLLCQADYQGRKGWKEKPYHQSDLFRKYFKAANQISAKDVDKAVQQGPKIGKEIKRLRIKQIQTIKQSLN